MFDLGGVFTAVMVTVLGNCTHGSSCDTKTECPVYALRGVSYISV